MTANPIELIGGLTTTASVPKADFVSWAKARVEQVLADVTEIRNTTLLGQLVIQLKSNGVRYIQDTTDTTTADDGVSCIVSSDGKRFKPVSSIVAPTLVSLGGVFASNAVSNQFLTGLDTAGNLLRAQPSAANLSNGVVGSGAVVLQTYVDTIAQGLDAKQSVLNATTANITLSGEQTIDGQLTSASRILVKNQTTTSQNGIYVTGSGAWTRALDADAWTELPGAFVFVEKGTTFADTGWVCTVDAGGTIGATAVTFTQFSGAGTYLAGTGLTLTGTTFAIDATVATLTGSQTLTGKTINGPSNTLTNIALSSHATQAAFTLVGNNTSGVAAPTAVDIAGLTAKTVPASTDLMLISDQAASGAWKKSTIAQVVGALASGVSSIAGNTGAFTLGAGLTNSVNVLQTDYSFAFRNRIINAAALIDQRNEGAALTLSTSVQFGPDRWLALRGTNVSTIQRNLTGGPTVAAGGANIPSFLRVQRTAANTGTGVIQLGQIIESKNMVDLAGQPVVVSFYARCGANFSPTSSLLNVQLRSGTTADEGNAGFVAGTWAGAAIPINQNATLTTSWQRFSYTVTLGSTALEAGIFFVMTPTGTAGAADYFDITGAQIEYGAAATPFEALPYSEIALRCVRYYWKSFKEGVAPAQNTTVFDGSLSQYAVIANTDQYIQQRFPAPMFKTPSLTFYNPNAANANWSAGGVAGANGAGPATSNVGLAIHFTSAPTIAAGAFTSIHVTADAEL